MIRLSFKVNDKQLQVALGKVQHQLKNMGKVLKRAGKIVLQETDKQFGTEGTNLGEHWRPRTRQYSWPILNKTGAMKRSFSLKPTSPKDHIIAFNQLENSYFRYHQLGTRKMPQRAMFVLSSKMKDAIIHEFEVFVKEISYKFNRG